MSDSVRPHRQQPTTLPCPWHSPGKNTGVGCHFLLHCVKVKLLSRDWLIATPWNAAHQAPPSMGFSRQEYWSSLPLPSPSSGPSNHQYFLPLWMCLFWAFHTSGIILFSGFIHVVAYIMLHLIDEHYSNIGTYYMVFIHSTVNLYTNIPSTIIHSSQKVENNLNISQLMNEYIKCGICIKWSII